MHISQSSFQSRKQRRCDPCAYLVVLKIQKNAYKSVNSVNSDGFERLGRGAADRITTRRRPNALKQQFRKCKNSFFKFRRIIIKFTACAVLRPLNSSDHDTNFSSRGRRAAAPLFSRPRTSAWGRGGARVACSAPSSFKYPSQRSTSATVAVLPVVPYRTNVVNLLEAKKD